MPTSNFKLFDENKANMLSDSEYNSNAQRLNGVQSGVASSQLQNKFQYQASLMAYAIAQLMVQNGYDATDTTAVTTFVSNLSNTMLQKVADKANETQAKAGTDNTKWMTPALVKSAINKLAPMVSSILSNETKALYGLDDSATPDDVFSWLGKYKQHWWRRRSTNAGWYQVDTAATNRLLKDDTHDTVVYTYGDSISVSQTDGTITINSASSMTLKRSTVTVDKLAVLKGKYVKTDVDQQVSSSNVHIVAGDIYFVPADAAITKSYDSDSGSTYYYTSELTHVTAEYRSTIGDWEYLQSSSRSAYPDSGTSGGYEYEYLGIPFDNAVTAPKIETGSYVGTGTYGSNTRANTLTFSAVPKLVIISGMFPGSSCVGGAAIFNIQALRMGNGTWMQYGFYSLASATNGNVTNNFAALSGTTLQWYSNSTGAQMNATDSSGNPFNYEYIAIY